MNCNFHLVFWGKYRLSPSFTNVLTSVMQYNYKRYVIFYYARIEHFDWTTEFIQQTFENEFNCFRLRLNNKSQKWYTSNAKGIGIMYFAAVDHLTLP